MKMRSLILSLVLLGGALAVPGYAQDAGTSHPFLNLKTASMFTDTLRATFIARGIVTDVDYSNGMHQPIFRPLEYISGTAIEEQEIPLVMGTNADLSSLKGQIITCAVVKAENGTYGAAHGVQSITPEHLSPQTSQDFYEEIVALNVQYSAEIAAAHEENPVDGNMNYPPELVLAWADVLVRYMAFSGTQAAHHAGRELIHNPIFEGMIDEEAHLPMIADNLLISNPGSYDRGYGFLLLFRYNYPGVGIAEVMELIRGETANSILNHAGMYLRKLFDEQSVAGAIANIYSEKESETTQARKNAIVLAGAVKSKYSLPTLRPLVGNESDDGIKHELLATFREIPDEKNLGVLANYINGGDAENESGLHSDCLESRLLLKRALVAIASIDSEASNVYIDGAYVRARPLWLRQYLQFLTSPNKEWRSNTNLLNLEGDDQAISEEEASQED